MMTTYLGFVTILLLAQPRSGYTQNLGQVSTRLLTFAPLWITIGIVAFIGNRYLDNKQPKLVLNANAIFRILVSSLIIGLVFNLDYHKTDGCLVVDEQFLSPAALTLSFISLTLLTLGYLLWRHKFGLVPLLLELIFWTLRAIYYNGSLDLIVIGYFTMICWALRIAFVFLWLSERYAIQNTVPD